jgi:type VI secretion system VgrG family protein
MTASLSLTIEGHEKLELRPYAVDGTEALSQLYQFDIDCLGTTGEAAEALDLVGQRATLSIGLNEAETRDIFGVIGSVTTSAPTPYGEARYRFRLVPWVSRLAFSRSNHIHGTVEPVSVADIIESEMNSALRSGAEVADTDLRKFEHEIRFKNTASYPKRDHVTQYEETDFAFISRLAEHYGIFYFFEAANGMEKIIFADDNIFTKPLEKTASLSWLPWLAGKREAAPDTIQEFEQYCGRVPEKVWLQDYNYSLPHVSLLVSSKVDDRGRGNWVEYGDHYLTAEDGQFIARMRAEELRSHQLRWRGRSAVASLAPGRSFALKDHPYSKWNQEYLVVSVRHQVRIALPGIEPADWDGYRNQFEVMQLSVPFRPARVTPKPRMDGLIHGHIDGTDERDAAELDDQGRYKVRVPFNLSGAADDKASRFLRMAAPFGGDGDGMHFPLFPDTEVVLGCVNGDPDRPVILGAVPNPRNLSVVTSANSFRHRLVTRSGMGLELGTDGGGGSSQGGGGSSSNTMATQSAFGRAPALISPNAFGDPGQGAAERQMLQTPAAAMAEESSDEKNYARLYANTANYMRLGAAPPEGEDAKLTDPGSLGYLTSTKDPATLPVARTDVLFKDKPGVFTTAEGQIYTEASGDLGMKAGGEMILHASGTLGVSSGNQIGLFSTKETAHFAGASYYILSAAGITISSVGDLNTQTKGKAIDVSDARDVTIEGADDTLMVEKGSRSNTIKMGNDSLKIDTGNLTVELGKGSETHKIKMGDLSMSCDLGKISLEAMNSISLKVGSSSITIDQSGITLKGMLVTAEADTTLTMKGLLVETNGSASNIVKGAVVMIN